VPPYGSLITSLFLVLAYESDELTPLFAFTEFILILTSDIDPLIYLDLFLSRASKLT